MIGWTIALLACASLRGSEVEQSTPVVPEKEITNTVSETTGVSANQLGAIDLRAEFSGLEEQLVLRARQITIQPNGTVAEHEHQSRPGVAFILEGEATEHRSSDPSVKKAGEWAWEKTGTTHSWSNQGAVPTTALVVDLFVPETLLEIPVALNVSPEGDFPHENSGVNIVATDVLDLSEEHSRLAGKSLRLRVVDVAPAGVVAFHIHESRPGFAYVTNGTMLEHRPQTDPIERPVGSLAIEQDGVAHWWSNSGSDTARIVVVDVFATP